MKKQYCVIIEETISEEFELEAESKKDAISKAIELYENGEFILESGNVLKRKIAIVDDSDIGTWIEF